MIFCFVERTNDSMSDSNQQVGARQDKNSTEETGRNRSEQCTAEAHETDHENSISDWQREITIGFLVDGLEQLA